MENLIVRVGNLSHTILLMNSVANVMEFLVSCLDRVYSPFQRTKAWFFIKSTVDLKDYCIHKRHHHPTQRIDF